MKLTKDDKEHLKELLSRPGFKVMEKVAEDLELSVLRQLKTIDTTNEKHLAILAKNTQYLKGIEDFMKTLKSWVNEVANRREDY